jgi:hypothetical protein
MSLLLAMNLFFGFYLLNSFIFLSETKKKRKKIQLLIRNQIIKDFVAALIR